MNQNEKQVKQTRKKESQKLSKVKKNITRQGMGSR